MAKKTQEEIFAHHCLYKYGKTSGVWFESTTMRDYMMSKIIAHDDEDSTDEWAWRCTASMTPRRFAQARFNSVMKGLVKKEFIGQKMNRRSRLLYKIMYDTPAQKTYWDGFEMHDGSFDSLANQSPRRKRGDLSVILYQPNSYFPYEDVISPVFQFGAPCGRKLKHGKIDIHRGKPKWWAQRTVVFFPQICTWTNLLAINAGDLYTIVNAYKRALHYAELRSHEDTKYRYPAVYHCSWRNTTLAKDYLQHVLHLVASEDGKTKENGIKLLRSYMYCFHFLKSQIYSGRPAASIMSDKRYDLCNFNSNLQF